MESGESGLEDNRDGKLIEDCMTKINGTGLQKSQWRGWNGCHRRQCTYCTCTKIPLLFPSPQPHFHANVPTSVHGYRGICLQLRIFEDLRILPTYVGF